MSAHVLTIGSASIARSTVGSGSDQEGQNSIRSSVVLQLHSSPLADEACTHIRLRQRRLIMALGLMVLVGVLGGLYSRSTIGPLPVFALVPMVCIGLFLVWLRHSIMRCAIYGCGLGAASFLIPTTTKLVMLGAADQILDASFFVPLALTALLTAVSGAVLLSLAAAFYTAVSICRHSSADTCRHCGYSVVGLPTTTCPECGQVNERAGEECGQVMKPLPQRRRIIPGVVFLIGLNLALATMLFFTAKVPINCLMSHTYWNFAINRIHSPRGQEFYELLAEIASGVQPGQPIAVQAFTAAVGMPDSIKRDGNSCLLLYELDDGVEASVVFMNNRLSFLGFNTATSGIDDRP